MPCIKVVRTDAHEILQCSTKYLIMEVWWICVPIAVIFMFCWIPSPLRYQIRFLIFMIYTFISTIIFVPFMLHRPRDSRNGLMPAWAVRWCSRLFLGLTFEVRGQENILPQGQGCVVVVNHQSSLDIIVMTYIWPYIPNGHTVTKKEVFWIYPFPWLWNTVFIDRLNPERAMTDINKVGSLISSKHARLCMFPEGTRHSGATLLPFKKGAFHVALAAQCPVQPVVVSKYHFLDHQDKRFDSGHGLIEFLPAIPTVGKSVTDVIEETRTEMQKAFSRLSTEAARRSEKPPIN